MLLKGDSQMVDQQVGNFIGVTAIKEISQQSEFGSIENMKERLSAIDGSTFTKARMNIMTYNDLVYALRTLEYPESIR